MRKIVGCEIMAFIANDMIIDRSENNFWSATIIWIDGSAID